MKEAREQSTHAPDWERIELDYWAGIKTLRQIGAEHNITHGAINKRAKRDRWERDLSEKIQAKADALVSRAAVSTPVSADTRVKEQAVVDANAHAVADVRLAHRRDIHRARRLKNALLYELERQTDPDTLVLLEELGELLKNPDEKTGRDRLNEVYQAVISLPERSKTMKVLPERSKTMKVLPERSKTMKVLAESLQKLVDMERQAFGMNDKEAAPVDGLTRMLKAITGSGASAFQPVARDPEHDEG